MHIIVAQLKAYIHKNEKTGRYPYGQARYIDNRKSFMLPQVAQSDFEIVFYHFISSLVHWFIGSLVHWNAGITGKSFKLQ
jgi:hypothetical protein